MKNRKLRRICHSSAWKENIILFTGDVVVSRTVTSSSKPILLSLIFVPPLFLWRQYCLERQTVRYTMLENGEGRIYREAVNHWLTRLSILICFWILSRVVNFFLDYESRSRMQVWNSGEWFRLTMVDSYWLF